MYVVQCLAADIASFTQNYLGANLLCFENCVFVVYYACWKDHASIHLRQNNCGMQGFGSLCMCSWKLKRLKSLLFNVQNHQNPKLQNMFALRFVSCVSIKFQTWKNCTNNCYHLHCICVITSLSFEVTKCFLDLLITRDV